jgi:pantothenate kinase
MDGFHYSRAKLDTMPDPAEAHRRRGAAFTFDAAAYAGLIGALRAPIEAGKNVLAPSFDHAIKDPVADDVVVRPDHRIVVVEGNYVGLADEPWSGAARMLDAMVFVEVDEKVATERLVRRHVAAGIVQTEEEGLERARGNDLVNGREIATKKVHGVPFEVIISKEDIIWAKETGE